MARTFKLQSRTAAGAIDWSAELNKEQLAVVAAPGGPMLVVAGAGTGKTRALTYRLAWLVGHGVSPSQIMLVTFTNRAAREMLSRVELLVKQQTRDLWGGTFHHIANRLLRQYGTGLGIQPDFTILDREDAKDLLASCVTEAGVDIRTRRFPQKSVLASYLELCPEHPGAPGCSDHAALPDVHPETRQIEQVLVLFASKKAQRQLLDYDDLLSAWLRLLTEHPDIRERLADQFQHILVDEYQDTNAIQGAVVDLLAARHRNLTVVGDDSQSIYSFRGATSENILSFMHRYPDTKEYRLEANYRSTPEILHLANASVAQNTRRLPKELRALRPSGLKPAVVPVRDHFVQSCFIAEYILHLLDQGRKLNDVAVLYRSHWHSLEIQLELQRRNIPFHVRGGIRFFEQAHIKDMLCYLRLLHNGHDELAWIRVLKMLPRIGGALSARIWQQVAGSDDPLDRITQVPCQGLVPRGVQPFFEQFVALLNKVRGLGSPAEAIDAVMAGFYDDYLVSHYDGASLRREDIKGLANYAAQYKTVEAFLTDVALAGEFSGETVVTGPEEQEFVTLSTVHQAKGLEWPVVFIPWLADGRFPTDLAINTGEDLEEERRVFHVAVTRAKDEVYLIVPQIFSNRSKSVIMMKPSRFLTELPQDLTEPLHIEESLPYLIAGSPKEPEDTPRLPGQTDDP